MLDIRGKEQPTYIVIDKKTGKKYATYESHAKNLARKGAVKIETEVKDRKQIVQEGDGK